MRPVGCDVRKVTAPGDVLDADEITDPQGTEVVLDAEKEVAAHIPARFVRQVEASPVAVPLEVTVGLLSEKWNPARACLGERKPERRKPVEDPGGDELRHAISGRTARPRQ